MSSSSRSRSSDLTFKDSFTQNPSGVVGAEALWLWQEPPRPLPPPIDGSRSFDPPPQGL